MTGRAQPLTLLVTRPEPGASATAARLRALGHHPVALPLTEVVATGLAAPSGTFDAIAFTSANGVRLAEPASLATLTTLPAYCVGTRTAGAAHVAGFATIVDADGDAKALARRLLAARPALRQVLYACGETRRPDIENHLREAGIRIAIWETYRASEVSQMTESGVRELSLAKPDAVLLYSPVAARLAGRLALRPDLAQVLANARFLCLSPSVEAALPAAIAPRAMAASAPDESSLFRLLDRLKDDSVNR